MNNMKEKKVLEIAKYIIENKATISVVATKFNVSISSVKKYINNDLPTIDLNIYNAVKKVQQELIETGQKVGGLNGKRGPKFTDFEAIEIAQVMIENSLTLDEASAKFNIPRSTIYDRIRNIKDDKIQEELDILFVSARKGSR